MQEKIPSEFPFRSQAQIWAFGRFGQGGWITISNANSRTRVQLPPALFDVLAILMRAAKQVSSSEDWVPSGFLSAANLCRELKLHSRDTPNPLLPDLEHVTKYIYRLRKVFAKAMNPRVSAKNWARSMLEWVPFLGYRLSTPPQNLHLAILKDPKDKEGDALL